MTQTIHTDWRIIETPGGERLHIPGELPDGFHGEAHPGSAGWLCPLDAPNAASLRRALPWTGPTRVGLRKSVGCGDRLGLATPGHIAAVRDGDMFPVFAQQSIREMTRAQRTPQQVMDDATWGVFRADYRGGWGSDADHLKTTEDIDRCIAAGYTGFTLDPGGFVDNAAHTDTVEALLKKFAALNWLRLGTSPDDLRARYKNEADDVTLMRAACKYGAAISEVERLSAHIAQSMAGRAVDLEVSVDETETPTSPFEHHYIAAELRRLGVPFTGLAPRFIGDFEKGVDYKGDLTRFEAEFVVHAELARGYGYKLSIHSGSDKFSIYPIIARYAGELVHLKTAGTSWLEALRVIAMSAPDLFREMLMTAITHYPTDRASYHVSAEAARVPTHLPDTRLPELLDQHDARQVLHVTFGTLMTRYKALIYTLLGAQRTRYAEVLKIHFDKHIGPFKAKNEAK